MNDIQKQRLMNQLRAEMANLTRLADKLESNLARKSKAKVKAA